MKKISVKRVVLYVASILFIGVIAFVVWMLSLFNERIFLGSGMQNLIDSGVLHKADFPIVQVDNRFSSQMFDSRYVKLSCPDSLLLERKLGEIGYVRLKEGETNDVVSFFKKESLDLHFNDIYKYGFGIDALQYYVIIASDVHSGENVAILMEVTVFY